MPPLPGQEEPIARMVKIVNAFLTRPDSGPFREPVDWRGLELLDYPEVIKKMMDLGTIKRKLDRGQYQTAHQVAQDIRLVWSNCMRYNAEGSDFWLLAKTFNRRFEDRYRKVTRDYDVGEELEDEDEEVEGEDDEEEEEDEEEDEDEEEEFEAEFEGDETTPSKSSAATSSDGKFPPSLDQRADFASNLLLLNGLELGHVVRTLELECPKAIETHQALPEKMEIVVDALDPALFFRLEKYVEEHASQRQRKLVVPTPDLPPINDISNKRKRKS